MVSSFSFQLFVILDRAYMSYRSENKLSELQNEILAPFSNFGKICSILKES
jgi:hypothetical protein